MYIHNAAAKSLQSCPTLCDLIDGSPPGSSIPGIFQARTLEWVAISFSNARKWKVKVKSLSCVQPLVTPWTATYQAPPSMGFARQQYWKGLPLPSPNRQLNEYKRTPSNVIDHLLTSITFRELLKSRKSKYSSQKPNMVYKHTLQKEK